MDPLTLALIGAGVGAGKSMLIDAPKEARQRKLAAETQRLSPWTGLRAGQIEEADPFGESMRGGLTGASLGQGMASQDMAKKNMEIQNEYMKALADRERAAVDSAVAGPYARMPSNRMTLGEYNF